MAEGPAGSPAVSRLPLERYLHLLPALAGSGYLSVVRVEPINSGQRNLICRVVLHAEEEDTTCIVKTYARDVDRFFDSHYRREEKILSLLNRWFTGRVPRLYGSFMATGRLAVLLMEDVGRQLLDSALAHSQGPEHRQLVATGVQVLCDFHTVTAEHYQPFYRTCQSIDLDRLNAPTFERRLEVALGRIRQLHRLLADEGRRPAPPPFMRESRLQAELAALGREAAPPRFFKLFRQHVTAPLLKAPRSIVHNSFSPVHVILNSQPKLIDYETMAVGAAQIDLAELLESPVVTLDDEDKLAFVETYYRAMKSHRGDSWDAFAHVYYCAVIARSLDYAGTTAHRYGQYRARGDQAGAANALRRHVVFLKRACHALRAIREESLADVVANLMAAVA